MKPVAEVPMNGARHAVWPPCHVFPEALPSRVPAEKTAVLTGACTELAQPGVFRGRGPGRSPATRRPGLALSLILTSQGRSS